MSGAVEDSLEDDTDGFVTSVSGEDEGKTRRWEFKVGCVREGPFWAVEGCCLRAAPVEGLWLPRKGGVERSHGGGDVGQEYVVIVDHSDKLLQGFHGGGRWKGTNCSNLLLKGRMPLEEI